MCVREVSNIDISIIVPVYNLEHYLDRCLSSLVNQHFENFEIILVNDGSKDSSGQICEEWCNRYNNIKVFHIANHGVSYARNVGIKNSLGKYVMFVDGDDWIEKDTLIIAYELMEKNQADIVLFDLFLNWDSNRQMIFNNYNERCLDFGADAAEELFRIWGCWAKLYRKECIDGIYFKQDMGCGEDLFFNYELVINEKFSKIVSTNVPLYHYYQRENSAIRSLFKEEWFFSFERECIIAEKLAEKFGKALNTNLVKNGMELFLRGVSCLNYKERRKYKEKFELYKKYIGHYKRFVFCREDRLFVKIRLFIKVYFPEVFILLRRGIACLR